MLPSLGAEPKAGRKGSARARRRGSGPRARSRPQAQRANTAGSSNGGARSSSYVPPAAAAADSATAAAALLPDGGPGGCRSRQLVEVERDVEFERRFDRLSSEQRRAHSAGVGEKHLSRLEKKLAAATRRNEKLSAQNERLGKEVEALTGAPDAAADKLAHERLRVRTLEQNIASLKRERRGLVQESAAEGEAARRLEGTTQELEARLVRSERECEVLRSELQEAGRELIAEREVAQRQRLEGQALVRSLATYKEGATRLTALVDKAQAQRTESEAVNGVLAAAHAELEQQLLRARQRGDDLKERLGTARFELDEQLAARAGRCEVGCQAEDVGGAEAAAAGVLELVVSAAVAQHEESGGELAELTRFTERAAARAVAAARAMGGVTAAATAAGSASASLAADGGGREGAAPRRSGAAAVGPGAAGPGAAAGLGAVDGVIIRPTSPVWWVEAAGRGHQAAPPSERALRTVFRAFDTDRSGTIDGPELAAIFAKFGHTLSEVEARAMIAQADADSSGTVDFEVSQNGCSFESPWSQFTSACQRC
jgi:hypothetical protein